MLSDSSFIILIILFVIVQEILDRLAIKKSWLEKPCIIYSIVVGVFCLQVMRPDSFLRDGDSLFYLIGSIAGLLYFGLFRHWMFIFRVKKHRKQW